MVYKTDWVEFVWSVAVLGFRFIKAFFKYIDSIVFVIAGKWVISIGKAHIMGSLWSYFHGVEVIRKWVNDVISFNKMRLILFGLQDLIE